MLSSASVCRGAVRSAPGSSSPASPRPFQGSVGSFGLISVDFAARLPPANKSRFAAFGRPRFTLIPRSPDRNADRLSRLDRTPQGGLPCGGEPWVQASGADCMFSQLGLEAPLARAVADQGYTIPTPIQTKPSRRCSKGATFGRGADRDRQDGGVRAADAAALGKQSAPSAPVAYPGTRGSRDARRKVRGLILTPTRELAAQVSQDLKTYGRHMPLRSCVIFGGVGFGPAGRRAAARDRHRRRHARPPARPRQSADLDLCA